MIVRYSSRLQHKKAFFSNKKPFKWVVTMEDMGTDSEKVITKPMSEEAAETKAWALDRASNGRIYYGMRRARGAKYGR